MISNSTLKNLTLTLLSLVLVFALLLSTECAVRLFTDVGRLGTSKDLFINNAFGQSIGNSPSSKTVAFGIDVFLDAQGFRTSARGTPTGDHDNKILILGDSVAFGVGVGFEQTVAARLSSAFPDFQPVNTAVIGYGVNDYLNVNNAIFQQYAETTSQVVLIFCLNDVSVVSATTIRSMISHFGSTGQPNLHAGFDVRALREIQFISQVNSYLRSRSSLYVLMRGLLTDPQTRYWKNELANYQEISVEALQETLQPVYDMAQLYGASDIPFTVFILPFAGQMDRAESTLPQRRLTAIFDSQGIQHVDMLPSFRANTNPVDLFLPYDPMHLSPDGHDVLFQAIRDRINQSAVTGY